MIRFLFIYVFIFQIVFAQDEKYSICKFSYYKNTKKNATKICFDADNRFGITQAFDPKGNKIYERYLRNVGGHASVSYEYYSNGCVKKIYFSDAPDGGIQFFNETLYFSPEGVQTDKIEQKYPLEPTTYFKIKQEDPVKSPIKQEVATCQVAVGITNLIFVNNNTQEALIVLVKSTQYVLNTELKSIKPKKEVLIGFYQTIENSVQPNLELSFELYTKKMKKIDSKYTLTKRDEYLVNEKTKVRKYVYDIVNR